MRIINVRKIEDCFDGSTIYGYTFDTKWDYEAIQKLRSIGRLDYFPDFPKPFFRLIGTGGLQMKGVQGECECTVFFPESRKEEIKREFEMHFNYCES